jgi:hypothetical protein
MADPIWLQKLKRALSGPERITPERPNFTGTAGVAKFDSEIGPMGAVIGAGLVDPHLAAAAGGPGWGSGMAPSTMTKAPVAGKKGSNKLKYIVEALQELEGPEPPKLAAGKYGRAMPRALGFSLPGMGGRLGEQEAMAKARREEELQRRMKLMGGGY